MSAINTAPQPVDADKIIAETESAVAHIKAARTAIGRVIYGQESVVDRSLITILAGGHGLLVGVPGLAKTKLVETLGTVLGLRCPLRPASSGAFLPPESTGPCYPVALRILNPCRDKP